MKFFRDIKIYFQMLFNYKPKKFWNELLSNSFDLRGVGHYRLSEEENLKMYQQKKNVLDMELKKNSIAINNDTKVLEVGCGVGYWTEYLKDMGVIDYTGNDIAEISISKLKEKYPDYKFLLGDISELTLNKEIYDIAVMIDVTQHITDDKKFNAAMKNIWSSIKDKGYFIVTRWDPEKNVYLSNKLRLNRIEKPRELDLYMKAFDGKPEILTDIDFNDKYFMIIRKNK